MVPGTHSQVPSFLPSFFSCLCIYPPSLAHESSPCAVGLGRGADSRRLAAVWLRGDVACGDSGGVGGGHHARVWSVGWAYVRVFHQVGGFVPLTSGMQHPQIDEQTGAVQLVLTQYNTWCPQFSLSTIVGALQLLFHLDTDASLACLYQLAPRLSANKRVAESRRVSLEAIHACDQAQRLFYQPVRALLPDADSDEFPPSHPVLIRSVKRSARSVEQDRENDDDNGNKETKRVYRAPTSCAMQDTSSNMYRASDVWGIDSGISQMAVD
jgi:hypothetical protein